jgi:flavin reductase (DIM6/NTAB) family NADH-FMN oxidoreductase RutF
MNKMNKINIGPSFPLYPMPVTLVGAIVEGRPNFLTVAWISRVNLDPPLLAVALNKLRYTTRGVQEHRTFSVNIPGVDLVAETDYCGLVSGKEVDKSGLFQVFYGELKTAPLIRECPLNLECRVVEMVTLPTHLLFIGEVVGAYTEERFLSDGKPDMQRMKPFVFLRPEGTYWKLGEKIGEAYRIGKEVPGRR